MVGRSTYADVITPAVWDGDTVRMVDLDLDVVRRNDGTVEIADEDEFDEHRVALGYPAHVVDPARTEAAQSTLREGHEPFGMVGDRWLEVALWTLKPLRPRRARTRRRRRPRQGRSDGCLHEDRHAVLRRAEAGARPDPARGDSRLPAERRADYRAAVLALVARPHREEWYVGIEYASAFPQYVTLRRSRSTGR